MFIGLRSKFRTLHIPFNLFTGIDSNNGDKKMNFIDARDTFMCRMVRKNTHVKSLRYFFAVHGKESLSGNIFDISYITW